MKTCTIIIILLIIIISFVIYSKGYIPYYPSIKVYPNNKNEVVKLKKIINYRTREDVYFFFLTNKSVVHAFKRYVNESIDTLQSIVDSKYHTNIILTFKYIINRQRPNQVDKSIIPINTDTAKTPAFPAGHAYQAYLLAHLF